MMSKLSRKDFGKLAWKSLLAMSGLLGLGGLLRFLGYQPDLIPQTVFDLGAADNFPPVSRTIISDAQAVILRDGDTFTALSLVCPHLGCQVELVPQGFACPCHGSHFDPYGNVRRGPANQPLRSLRLKQTSDGKLILHTKDH